MQNLIPILFDHALDLTNESQALYGTEADVSWTQILKMYFYKTKFI